jgi:hypothetical protein
VPVFTIVIGDADQARRELAEMRRQEVEQAVKNIPDPEIREREAKIVGEEWDADLRRPN